MVDTEQWFYNAGTDSKGSFSRDQMTALIDAGVIQPQTLVWTAAMANWERLDRTPLRANLRVPGVPPMPPSYASTPAFESAGVGFGEAIKICLTSYATFRGVASRSEFWYFVLFSALAGLATALLDAILFGADGEISPLNTALSLALILPQLAVGCRRLHDTDRSGWWQLFALVPLVGTITVIVFWCQKGTPDRNRFE